MFKFLYSRKGAYDNYYVFKVEYLQLTTKNMNLKRIYMAAMFVAGSLFICAIYGIITWSTCGAEVPIGIVRPNREQTT